MDYTSEPFYWYKMEVTIAFINLEEVQNKNRSIQKSAP